MNMLFLLLLVPVLLLSACGEGERAEIEGNNTSEVVNRAENQMASVSVTPGRGVYSDIIWVYCSPTDSNAWGDQYQPVVEGDTVSFQLEPGLSYDFTCMSSDLIQYFKWEVPIDEEGFTWQVEESDPDNLFRYYSHFSDSSKDVCLFTVRSHRCGVLSSLVMSAHGTYIGDINVEQLDGIFIQPNSDYQFRVRSGGVYNITVSNTYGENFYFPNVPIEGSSLVFELTN